MRKTRSVDIMYRGFFIRDVEFTAGHWFALADLPDDDIVLFDSPSYGWVISQAKEAIDDYLLRQLDSSERGSTVWVERKPKPLPPPKYPRAAIRCR